MVDCSEVFGCNDDLQRLDADLRGASHRGSSIFCADMHHLKYKNMLMAND